MRKNGSKTKMKKPASPNEFHTLLDSFLRSVLTDHPLLSLWEKVSSSTDTPYPSAQVSRLLLCELGPALRTELCRGRRHLRELWVTGKLLEKSYIHSTDIEFAQFYNKELALRLDQLVREERPDYAEEETLQEEVSEAFAQIEHRRENNFSTN